MTSLEMLVDIASQLLETGDIKTGDDYVLTTCQNPDHDDPDPSMSLFLTDNGHWGVKCHGCDIEPSILRHMLQSRFPELSDKPSPKPAENTEFPESDIPSDKLKLIKGLAPSRSKTEAWIPIHECDDKVFKHHSDIIDLLATQKGKMITPYYYTDASGHVAAIRVRITDPLSTTTKGKPAKSFSWLNTFIYNNNGKKVVRYALQEMGGQAPIYRRHALKEGQPVLIVEGEKTADAAAELFPSFSVISWGTANNIAKTDWSVVPKTHPVFVWCDNDAPGHKYIRGHGSRPGLGKILAARGIDVRIVSLEQQGLEDKFPVGWDLADPLPAGFDQSKLQDILGNALLLREWLAGDTVNVCALKRFDPTIDVEKPCSEHWNDPRLETDPYGIGVSVEPIPGKYGKGYLVDNKLPIGRAICNACPYAGLGETPAEIASLEPVFREAVYHPEMDRVFSIEYDCFFARTALNATLSADYPQQTPFKVLSQDRSRNIAQIENEPGMRRIIERDDGKRILNLWRSGDCPAILTAMSPPTRFLRIAELAVPDENARNLILDWIAWQLQRPNEPVIFMPILSGGQGTGKDSILRPLLEVLGRKNMVHVTRDMLRSQFNDYLKAQVVVFQELERADWASYNKIKTQVTSEITTINIKGLPAYAIHHKPNLIALTNAENPIKIEKDDRRVWIYRSPLTAKQMKRDGVYHLFREYYDRNNGYMSQIDEFITWALRRDLSNFDPGQAAITKAKEQLIRDSIPKVGQFLIQLAVEGKIDKPVLRVVDIRRYVERFTEHRYSSPSALGAMLRNSGFRKLGYIPVGNGSKRDTIYIFSEDQYADVGAPFPREFYDDMMEANKIADEWGPKESRKHSEGVLGEKIKDYIFVPTDD